MSESRKVRKSDINKLRKVIVIVIDSTMSDILTMRQMSTNLKPDRKAESTEVRKSYTKLRKGKSESQKSKSQNVRKSEIQGDKKSENLKVKSERQKVRKSENQKVRKSES